jgi:hypothetical protein
MLYASSSLEAVIPAAKVQELELIGVSQGKLGKLDINPADPVALLLKISDQVGPDESAGACYENLFHIKIQKATSAFLQNSMIPMRA